MPEGGKGNPVRVLAVDTGGTFTDVLLLDAGHLRVLKVPSTPADPAEAVLQGARALVNAGEAYQLLHGSTVATNALLERTGARVCLVTNSGFEDILEIGRQNRPQLYALVGHRLPPLVARHDRIGVRGRLGPDGAEIEPLDAQELRELPGRLDDAEAIAVVMLHSYADAAHEQRIGEALAALGVPVSLSSTLLPEYREYERTSTTVVNAYVGPIMSAYLGRLDRESAATRVRIMGSNGGALPVERAIREPAHTVLSGPAGGVVGALEWARRVGNDHIITFDMGGTSTDVSLCPGELLHTREFQIGEQPVALPVLDIHTVGAGGGSIARLDPGGALRVGPASAGAVPGPICYGRGGTAVTVTDAHVWLGRLPAEGFLGGTEALDRDAIAGPLAELAEGLGLDPDTAAEGVLAVADSAMERALRVISVERGFDPAEFTVVAFGGAGALHVAELASRLGARGALVPPDPGLLSAYGMLAADVVREASRTVLAPDDAPDVDALLEEAFVELEASALDAMLSEGVAAGDIRTQRWMDVRYAGQSFELRIPAADWRNTFHTAHESRYGYARSDAPLEAVTVRARLSAPGPKLSAQKIEAARSDPPLESCEVIHAGKHHPATRVWRADLRAGHRIDGPAIILEYSATTWVPAGWTALVDDWGCLHLNRTENDMENENENGTETSHV